MYSYTSKYRSLKTTRRSSQEVLEAFEHFILVEFFQISQWLSDFLPALNNMCMQNGHVVSLLFADLHIGQTLQSLSHKTLVNSLEVCVFLICVHL